MSTLVQFYPYKADKPSPYKKPRPLHAKYRAKRKVSLQYLRRLKTQKLGENAFSF